MEAFQAGCCLAGEIVQNEDGAFFHFFLFRNLMRMVSALFVVACDIGPSHLENRSGRTMIVRLSELNNERAVRA